jgi:hypothetical protein
MIIPAQKIYPRTNDFETVYLKSVVTDPNIIVGDYTMYNDFISDPTQFEKNNVLYHYPVNHDRLFAMNANTITKMSRPSPHRQAGLPKLNPQIVVRYIF